MTRELVRWTKNETGVTSTSDIPKPSNKLFRFATAYVNHQLDYDILNQYKIGSDIILEDRDNILACAEFFTTLSRNAHIVEHILSIAKTKLNYDVFVAGKVLTVKTKAVVTPTAKGKKNKAAVTTKPVVTPPASGAWNESDIIYNAEGVIDLAETPLKAIEALYPAMVDDAMKAKTAHAKKLVSTIHSGSIIDDGIGF